MKLSVYSGAGNTFAFVDNRDGAFAKDKASEICKTEGVDGVILIESAPPPLSAKMRTLNRDGSEAEMCGNGLRCCIAFLKELGIDQEIYHIETLAGQHRGWLSGHEICVALSAPHSLKLHVFPDLHFVNTGVPHAVCFVENLEQIDVAGAGKIIRHSSIFAPAGANANFATLNTDGTITLRTYERGVEAETRACGTGAAATALIAHKLFGLPSPIAIKVRSQEILRVSFDHKWSTITLQGPVKRLYQNYL